MLTISEIAKRFSISYKQVNDLIDYGFLPVAKTLHSSNKGIKLLFSIDDINKLDIPSALAEIKDLKNQGIKKDSSYDFRKVLGVMNYYNRFLDNIDYHPDKELLEIAFYLFHLNHYAKKYNDLSSNLYNLKNKVIRKMYTTNSHAIDVIYLIGPDRTKVWLCEDCKESARLAGMSYVTFIRKEYYCPKCFVQSIEKEYYSLIEFNITTSDYRFTFHLPKYKTQKWMHDLNNIPQGIREIGKYDDKMYLYGRLINRIEEKIFPLNMIIEKLERYIG